MHCRVFEVDYHQVLFKCSSLRYEQALCIYYGAVSVEDKIVIPAHLIHINKWNFVFDGIVGKHAQSYFVMFPNGKGR